MKTEKLKDFRNFLYVIWKHLRLPPPTALQYDIATYLQSQERRIIIEGFRGIGKSWITSTYVCFQLFLNPQLNILVVSASKTRADDASTFILRIINEVPILQHLIPKDSQRQSKISFDVAPARASHQPSVKSVGIFGQMTGSRSDFILADDIETPLNSMTQGMRDRLSEGVKEFESIIKPSGKVIFLGTPQCEQSLYNALPERGYKKRIWTAKYPSSKQTAYFGKTLAPIIYNAVELNPELKDKPTEPTRFDKEDLDEREASYGRSQFALQFMLDSRISDSDRYPLKLSDLIITSINPDKAYEKYVWAANPENRADELPCVGMSGDFYHRPMDTVGDLLDFTGCIMAIDPSGKGQDETGYSCTKFLNGQIFVTAAGGFRGGYNEVVLAKLVKIAKEQKVKLILVEENFGAGMFMELLKPYLFKEYPCTLEGIRHTVQKEKRIIDTLEPLMNQHRLIVSDKVVQDDYTSTQIHTPEMALRYQLFYQMSRITRDKGSLAHDDRLDVLAMSCEYWNSQIARDADMAVMDRKEELFQKELDKFLDRPNSAETWWAL
jgi:hypothetical protein